MIESVERLVMSGKWWFIIIIIGLIIFSVKIGLLKVKTDKIQMGRDFSDEERAIIRNQCESVKKILAAFEQAIPRWNGYDEFRGKYILELLYDEIVNWIIYNHVENKEAYVSLKQEAVWNIVQANVTHKKMRSKEFKQQVDEQVAHIIQRLIDIRKEYE